MMKKRREIGVGASSLILSVLLLTASASIGTVHAQSTGTTTKENRGFHPDMPAAWFMDPDWQNTTECTIPYNNGEERSGNYPDFLAAPYQQEIEQPIEKQPELCPGNLADASAILDNPQALQALAVAYAPHLFFHPLENYTLSAVERTTGDPERGQILEYIGSSGEEGDDGFVAYDDNINVTAMMLTARDPHLRPRAEQFYIEHDLGSIPSDGGTNYRAGDGFRVKNDNAARREIVSNAPLYYNAHAVTVGEGDATTITINYYTYYTWRGPSAILVNGIKDDEYVSVQTILPDMGVSEGNWQGMSVTVCNQLEPTTPIGITYRARNHGQQLDCTLGECMFYQTNASDDTSLTNHPVAFVALSSHGLYPSPSDFTFYSDVGVGNWLTLQNVYLVDNTRYYIDAIGEDGQPVDESADAENPVPREKTGVRSFEPDVSNIIKLPRQIDIPHNVTSNEYWAAFRGHFGRRKLTEDELDTSLTCMSSDSLSYIDCPDLQDLTFFNVFMQLLGLVPPESNFIELAVDRVRASVQKYFGGANEVLSITGSVNQGPATTSYYRKLVVPSNAHIWKAIGNENITGKEFCYDLKDFSRFDFSSVETLNVGGSIMGIIWMTVALAGGAISYFIIAKRGKFDAVIDKDEDGKLLPPSRKTKRWVYAKAWFFTGAYLWVLLAVVVFLAGYGRSIALLEDTFNVGIPAIADVAMAFLVIWVLMLDTCLFVILWLRTDDLWQLINQAYYTVVGDDEGLASFEHRLCIRHNHRRISKAYMVMFGCLMVTLVLSLLMCVIGCFIAGIAFMFGYYCKQVQGSLDNVCLNLSAIGLGDVTCGTDFAAFCNEWSRSELLVTMWGAFAVAIGHFFIIAAAAMSGIHVRVTQRTLLMLPSPQEYQEGFSCALYASTTSMTNPQESVAGQNEDEDNEKENEANPEGEEGAKEEQEQAKEADDAMPSDEAQQEDHPQDATPPADGGKEDGNQSTMGSMMSKVSGLFGGGSK